MGSRTRTPGLALLSLYFTLAAGARRQWQEVTARSEAGESPLGTAVIVAVVLAAAVALGLIITNAVSNHDASIK